MVTRRAVWRRFMRGDSIVGLCRHFRVEVEFVEATIRQYMPRAFK